METRVGDDASGADNSAAVLERIDQLENDCGNGDDDDMKQALKESFNRSVVLGQSRPTGQVRAGSDGGRRHQQVGAVCHALDVQSLLAPDTQHLRTQKMVKLLAELDPDQARPNAAAHGSAATTSPTTSPFSLKSSILNRRQPLL
jgi:hypothetical protein